MRFCKPGNLSFVLRLLPESTSGRPGPVANLVDDFVQAELAAQGEMENAHQLQRPIWPDDEVRDHTGSEDRRALS
jgi:hypothetical protein